MRYLAWLFVALCGALAATPTLADSPAVPAADKAYSQGDYTAAARLWREACEDGNATGCYELAIMYRDGEGMPADPKVYRELLTRACDGGSGSACFNLGIATDPTDPETHKTTGTKAQQAAAATYFKKGCDLGEQRACANLAYYTKNGLGAARDAKLARELMERACAAEDKDTGRNCYLLSDFFDGHDENVSEENPSLANRYLLRGCNYTDVDACTNLGYHYRTAYGLPRDMVRSNTLYAMTCDDGSEMACPMFTYDEFFSGGGGYRQDNVRPSRRDVAGLYQKACDGGFALGCTALARLIMRSGHAQQSEPQILTLLSRALTLDPDCYAARFLTDYTRTQGLTEMDRRHKGEP